MLEESIIQKVGEILIIAPPGTQHRKIMSALCPKVMKSENQIEFGRYEAAPDLALFLYSITFDKKKGAIAWDLLARKMMGAIVVYNWEDKESLAIAKKILDLLQSRFDAPCVIAADVPKGPLPINKKIAFPYISLSSKDRFIFFNSNAEKSIRITLATLISIVSNFAE